MSLKHPGGFYGTSPIGKVGDTPPRPAPASKRAYADPVSGKGELSSWWNEEGRFDPRAAKVLWLDSENRVCDIQTDVVPEIILREVRELWGKGWQGATRTMDGVMQRVAVRVAEALKEREKEAAKMSGTVDQHHWAYFDYKDGWVGMRVEPEDQDRADAIKACIPSEERKYISGRRMWVFKPKWCRQIVQILQSTCPDVPVILEEKNAEILHTLLVGPRRYLQGSLSTANPPQGKLFGPISSISDWEVE
jgi:hypothetical protein